MTISAASLRKLSALNLSAEQMAGVLDVLAEGLEAEEARRQGQRDRTRRSRQKRDGDVTVTLPQRDGNSTVPSDKENPHTPKEINSLQPNPDPDGSAPLRSEIASAVDAYSAMAQRAGLAVPRDLNGARRQRLGAIIRSHGLPVWLEALGKVEASDFCRGQNDRGWKADFDFVTQAKSFARLLEGHYDNRARGSPQRPANALDLLRQQRESILDVDPAPERPRLIAAR